LFKTTQRLTTLQRHTACHSRNLFNRQELKGKALDSRRQFLRRSATEGIISSGISALAYNPRRV
jgi:hypothetical protein